MLPRQYARRSRCINIFCCRLPGHQAGFFGSPNCLQTVLPRDRRRELKLQVFACRSSIKDDRFEQKYELQLVLPQICAVKGKGKKQAQQMQSMGAPSMPVPPVDPDNVEFVVFVRATKGVAALSEGQLLVLSRTSMFTTLPAPCSSRSGFPCQ